ncbi:receptor activity-modifying protein 1 [Austrofundulus limnaeus]|uniref:Receptor activity-modifying protein 1 n=1 Tax=Austrofundulus limnaeus TaxID=52670 RepID=A0A2I4C6J7_AUSLI|nr:PREDICTED: receptor activity-modifying protein 1-like [Austrofundulus limnaeus]
MALRCVLILRAAVLMLLTAHVVPLASGCNVGSYETLIREFCLDEFHLNMRKLDPGLWCSWPDTMEIYKGLTKCTYQVALKVDCFWPNEVVDSFFMKIHQRYFNHCALTGRLLHDPPISILVPFIAIPVLVTLLMTAIVVWRSKRTEGVL